MKTFIICVVPASRKNENRGGNKKCKIKKQAPKEKTQKESSLELPFHVCLVAAEVQKPMP